MGRQRTMFPASRLPSRPWRFERIAYRLGVGGDRRFRLGQRLGRLIVAAMRAEQSAFWAGAQHEVSKAMREDGRQA